MITYKDIKKAINKRIKSEFDIDIYSNDVKEGFQRPSFFIVLDEPKRTGFLDQIEKSMTVRIHFFPSDRYDYSLEVMDILERLETIFDMTFSVSDRILHITETNNVMADGVLEFSFELNFFEGRPGTTIVKDREGEPVYDQDRQPIQIEIMQTLTLKKG